MVNYIALFFILLFSCGATRAVAAGESPFGIFGPFEYALDDPTVATDEDIINYLIDLGAPWVQEMYFTAAVPQIPQSINIYSRVGAEGGMMPSTCLAPDDPAWVQYEQNYAAALRNNVIEWKGRIQYFEVGTEPSGFAPPAGWKDCEQNYVDHLKTTYTVVKQECPECKVVYGGLPGVYIDFNETFYPVQFLDTTLAAGAASYFDVFEFKQHAHRALDYAELRNKYQVYTSIFAKYGLDLDQMPVFVETAMYDGDPFQDPINSQTPDLPYQTEAEQAIGLFKTYIFGLASGIDRIFWNLVIERYNFAGAPTNVFNMYGLVHNPRNDGLSSKKLSYYTYKKMVEVLEGSDWNTIQTISESDDVYIFQVTKNGKPVHIVWWDYFNDPAYVLGATKQVIVSGLQSATVRVTEVVPDASTGAEVTDYNSAFTTTTEWIVGGSSTINVGDSPVIVEEIGEPGITISPASNDFGSVNAGSSSAAQAFTVTNTGTSSLSISTVSITGTDSGQFIKQSDGCSGQVLSPSGSCMLEIVFSPTSSGAKTAGFEISSNDPVAPTLTLSLTGTGVQQYTLTVAGAAGSSTGVVTGGSTINCPIAADGTASGACTETGNPGSSLTLTATPAAGASVSWTNCTTSSGNTCMVALDGNKTTTASFTMIQVMADFSAYSISGKAPNLTVTFTDLSSGSPSSWSWDFGDGSTSNEQNPSHIYKNAGTYTVSLTVSNAVSADTKTRTGYIAVQECLNSPVRLTGHITEDYSTIQAAYDAASDGDVIKILAQDMNGDVTFNQDIPVTLEGGNDCDYTTKVGETTINGSMIIASGAVTVEGLVLSGAQPADAKRTFVMAHLEAGYKTCKENNPPEGLPADVCTKGWQETFWPTLIELVEKANLYGFKLTLAFTPQWAEFIANDSGRLDLVRQWKIQGHEIGFQHHPFAHIDWDGYSNEDPPDPNNPLYPLYQSLYLGRVDDGFSYMNTLAQLDSVISSTMGGLPIDFPSLMTSPALVYGVGNAQNSYPQLGEVRSLKPIRFRALIQEIERDVVELTIRAFSTVMDISLEEALPILQEQYRTMQTDEVFGIVWHEYDYYKSKDSYIQWFDFIKQNGNSVKTTKEIAGEYFE